MFPHHLLLALCAVCFACIACCGGASYAQTPAKAQAVTPDTLTAVELVANLATADDSARDGILKQLETVEFNNKTPLLRLMSPSLKLDPVTRWRAASVMYHRYTGDDAKFREGLSESWMKGKLNSCALEVCNHWRQQGPNGLNSLLAAVESPIDQLSQQALLALRSGRELKSEALDRLQKQLPQHPHAMDLALLLGKHGRVPPEAVPSLLAGLKMGKTMGCMYCASATPRVESGNAGEALSKIDPAAATAAAPHLIDALISEDQNVRFTVMAVLQKIDAPKAVSAVPNLIEALKIEDPSVRAAVAEILGKIGPAAKEAIPALIAARDCKVVRPAPRGTVGFFGPPPPQTFAIPAEATLALASIQLSDAKDDQKPAVQAAPAETDPDLLTKSLPGAWKIEITIAPKLLQRQIQEIREYLYLIVALQRGFQSQECQAKIGANGLALIQLPNINDTEKKPEHDELPVNWKVFKNNAGKTTVLVSHPEVGDLIFRGPIRQLDSDCVECVIMAPLPGDKAEEPSLPILIVKLQRVKQ